MLRSFALPVLSLGSVIMAQMMRMTRAAVLGDLRGRYGFSGGWHLSAFAAWAIGIVAYQVINQWLPNLGATLPSLAIGAVCYLALVSARKTAYA